MLIISTINSKLTIELVTIFFHWSSPSKLQKKNNSKMCKYSNIGLHSWYKQFVSVKYTVSAWKMCFTQKFFWGKSKQKNIVSSNFVVNLKTTIFFYVNTTVVFFSTSRQKTRCIHMYTGTSEIISTHVTLKHFYLTE